MQQQKNYEEAGNFLPFMKKRLEKEIDVLVEKLYQNLKRENSLLRLELAVLKADNSALKKHISTLFGDSNGNTNGR